MFDGIKLKTLLSTPEEWHALIIGFFEALCPWPSRYHLTDAEKAPLRKEYHYYMTGRGLGFPVLLLILVGTAKLIQEVLL
jgi:hypothetical protein